MSHPASRSKYIVTLVGLALSAAFAVAAVPGPQAQGTTERSVHSDEGGEPYAFVQGDKKTFMMSHGRSDDGFDVKDVRKQIDGDFLWFRDGGKAYVVQDPATLAQARTAWAPVDRLGEQMNAKGREMNAYGRQMRALGKDMSRSAATIRPDTTKIHEIERQMSDLGRKMGDVGRQMGTDNEAERVRLDSQMNALQRKMDDLSRQMDTVAHGEGQRIAQQSMDDIGRQMKEAGKPMEALGKQMEALGKQMEQETRTAERTVRALIRDAQAKGLARPAPRA